MGGLKALMFAVIGKGDSGLNETARAVRIFLKLHIGQLPLETLRKSAPGYRRAFRLGPKTGVPPKIWCSRPDLARGVTAPPEHWTTARTKTLPKYEILAKSVKGKVDVNTSAHHAGAVSSGSSATGSCTTSMRSTVASSASAGSPVASTFSASASPLAFGANCSTAAAPLP